MSKPINRGSHQRGARARAMFSAWASVIVLVACARGEHVYFDADDDQYPGTGGTGSGSSVDSSASTNGASTSGGNPSATGSSTSTGGAVSSSSTGPTTPATGESCADPIDLVTASDPSDTVEFEGMLERAYGTTDDYNPVQSSGKQPACSPVFDANGQELVYAITLKPGDVLRMRYSAFPDSVSGALYVLDDCSSMSWPDYDGSGMCGSNEYVNQGYCGVVGCSAVDFHFSYPMMIDGKPTTTKTFYVVLDHLDGPAPTGFRFDWAIDP